MRLKTAALAVAVLATIHLPAQAEGNSKAPGSGPNPFSDCGIGAALFSDTKWAAVTSNVIWDIGTTAVTSATASPETCNGKTVAAASFINDTYEKLAEETARGEGENLATLLNIFECAAPQHGRVIAAARNEMADELARPGYATQDRTEKAVRFYQAVEAAVGKSCAV